MANKKEINNPSDTIQCVGKCRRILKKNNFYKSNRDEYINLGGYCNICKSCLRELTLDSNNQINIDGIKTVLSHLDKPFLWHLFYKVNSDRLFDMGIYLRQLNTSQYKKMTFKDSDKDEDVNKKNDTSKAKHNTYITDDEEEFVITKEMIKRWGRNLSQDDYEFLEDTYSDWTHKYKSDTLAEEKTYQFLCLKELEIRKARESGGNVDKLEETYRKFMSDANVTPRDANAANDPENMNCLGLWIKDIEKYRPAEYFEDKKKYFDFYGLMDYLQRFVYRPLKNLLTGSRDFDKEFNVEKTESNEDTQELEDIKEGDS